MTTAPRFRLDNTDGYSPAQLVELNRRFDERAAALDPSDVNDKSTRDALAERVLAEFDSEPAPTPGPWVVVDDHPRGSCLYVREAGRPNSAYDVAVLWEPFRGGREARAANARLIAAAPRMLAKLRELAEECGECAGTRVVPRYDDLEDDETCDECADVWAVIDAAEGRA